MIYRIILYLISVIAYGFAKYFADKAPENATNLFEFWLILFALIIIEAGYQLRNSLYVLFPLGYLTGIGLQYFDIGQGMIYQGLGGWLHLILGVWLLLMAFRPTDKPTMGRNLLMFSGIGCLLFGLNGINYFLEIDQLRRLTHFRLSSYLLIATSGQVLLSEPLNHHYPKLSHIFRLVLIIHVYLIVGKVMDNFIGIE